VRSAEEVLIRPVVSEKSYALMEDGTYVFEVYPGTNRTEIRRAVEQLFNVHVAKVNTLNRKGKRRRNRRANTWGARPDRKRAMVTLQAGDRIDLFEKS
jgi:large subunit ribosomal protein L23